LLENYYYQVYSNASPLVNRLREASPDVADDNEAPHPTPPLPCHGVTVSPTEDNSTNTSASTSYGGEVYVHGLMSGEVLDGSEEFHK
jgi:hypothetical protein